LTYGLFGVETALVLLEVCFVLAEREEVREQQRMLFRPDLVAGKERPVQIGCPGLVVRKEDRRLIHEPAPARPLPHPKRPLIAGEWRPELLQAVAPDKPRYQIL